MPELAPAVFNSSLLGLAHPVLDLCEDLSDGVEIGRVSGQDPELCAGYPDSLTDGLGFVAAEIVEDDDIAGLRVGSSCWSR